MGHRHWGFRDEGRRGRGHTGGNTGSEHWGALVGRTHHGGIRSHLGLGHTQQRGKGHRHWWEKGLLWRRVDDMWCSLGLRSG